MSYTVRTLTGINSFMRPVIVISASLKLLWSLDAQLHTWEKLQRLISLFKFVSLNLENLH